MFTPTCAVRFTDVPFLVAQTALPSESNPTTDNVTPHYAETACLHLQELQDDAPLHEKPLWGARGCSLSVPEPPKGDSLGGGGREWCIFKLI